MNYSQYMEHKFHVPNHQPEIHAHRSACVPWYANTRQLPRVFNSWILGSMAATFQGKDTCSFGFTLWQWLTVCYWKWFINSWFTYSKWWFSTAMLVYQRVSENNAKEMILWWSSDFRMRIAVHPTAGQTTLSCLLCVPVYHLFHDTPLYNH